MSFLNVVAFLLLPYVAGHLGLGIFEFGDGNYFDPDSAEHLFVVYALVRGEVPFLDFMENHPTLFNHLLRVIQLSSGTDAIGVFQIGKLILYGHFAGCIFLLSAILRLSQGGRDHGKWLILIVAASALWAPANGLVWSLRPDWMCYFYALLAVRCHLGFSLGMGGRFHAVVGGVAAGLATAILAKSLLILVPYVLACSLYLIFAKSHTPDSGRPLRALEINNLLIVVTGVASYVAFVALDITVSGADFGRYWTSTITINRLKHIVAFAYEDNPLTRLADLVGLGFTGTLVFSILIGRLLIKMHTTQTVQRFYAVVGLALVVGVNLLAPGFANGVTWPHYFIPAYLALAVLATLVLRQGLVDVQRFADIPLVRASVLLVLAVILGTLLLQRYRQFEARFQGVAAAWSEAQALSRSGRYEPLPEQWLPKDLSYLTFDPFRKPVEAKAWGYYFMIIKDSYHWVHNASLGIGPSPATYWQSEYASAPPDVILIASERDFLEWHSVANRAQGLSLSWLAEALAQGYSCVQNDYMTVHVRRPLVTPFVLDGWQQCERDWGTIAKAVRVADRITL